MQRNELSETIGSGDQREKQPLLNASVHPPTQSLTHYHLHTHTHTFTLTHGPVERFQWVVVGGKRGRSGWFFVLFGCAKRESLQVVKIGNIGATCLCGSNGAFSSF